METSKRETKLRLIIGRVTIGLSQVMPSAKAHETCA